MKKQIVAAAAFAACLALCAAVWPQNEPATETPALPTPPAVIAIKPEVPELPEIEEIVISEEEKIETTAPEQTEETVTSPEPTFTQVPPLSVVQATSAQNATPPQEPEPAPALPDSASNNMVYVEGFGWLESQGPNHVEYAEDMYENGNKIGLMN